MILALDERDWASVIVTGNDFIPAIVLGDTVALKVKTFPAPVKD